MAYIRVVDENEAEGDLFKLYDKIQRKRGRLSNVLKIQSLDPKALECHLDLYMAIVYGKGPLSRKERELIAVVVSAANGCDYCVTHHSDALDKYAKDEAWVKAVADGTAKLEGREATLAHYAKGLTVSPATGRKEAVEAMRADGFTDEEILHASEIVAYFNFVNRLVHGLGVELEDDPHQDFEY